MPPIRLDIPDINVLHARLNYDPSTGMFTWKPIPVRNRFDATWNHRFAGKPAGHYRKIDGYLQICIDGSLYLGHRLAWAYVHGDLPREVRQRDGNPRNNAILNLWQPVR